MRVLERQGQVGGAAISARVFDGVDVRLSRYSYLVSLLPSRILADLGAQVRLVRRAYSSYTPDPGTGGRTGLLVGAPGGFGSIGAGADEHGFEDFYRRCRLVTERLWPTLLEPLRTRTQVRRLVVDGSDRDSAVAWRALTEEPVGHAIAAAVDNDVVRGVIATDALIGTFARLDDPSLMQNICLLYHVLGGGTGDWNVPIGGMGAMTSALAAAATRFGVEISTGADVFAIAPDGEVRYRSAGDEHVVRGRFVLSGIAPSVLAGLMGDTAPASAPGAQVKVNMVLRRLPCLRDQTVTPEQAFAGTFHINETWSQLDAGYLRAAGGSVPDPLPCEAYCHSLADPSIVSPELTGVHTMTVFGLHTPHSLRADAAALTDAVLESLNSVLAEPIQDVLLPDAHGRPCIETTTTSDLQDKLGMTAGNIFHGALDWPFAADDDPLDTPARRWGVATGHPPNHGVRCRRTPRRRCFRHRGSQRRDGGAGHPRRW
ncbi:hypothetical protein IWGMT90018_53210 [Mycobacterium kiyosense]|nr:hypothetical protein IWGMT90018_53210 [Mycobacterium kiyosense]